MTEIRNWLEDALKDASEKVAAKPPWRRSAYWEERGREIEERQQAKRQAQAQATNTEPPK